VAGAPTDEVGAIEGEGEVEVLRDEMDPVAGRLGRGGRQRAEPRDEQRQSDRRPR